MNATITVDKAGRVVLPKPVRDKLQLQAGDSLELDSSGGEIVLRPIRRTVQMRLRDGIWVFRTGQPISAASVNETIRQARDERLGTGSPSTGEKRRGPREVPLKVFFDTTVLVAAVLEDHEHYARSFPLLSAAERSSASCAAHNLAEVYVTLTRYPGKDRLSAEQTVVSLETIEKRLTVVSLNAVEYFAAIRRSPPWELSAVLCMTD